MNTEEQARFDRLYAEHLQALNLQGKRGKTVNSSARAVRRIVGYFDRCTDDLSVSELKGNFTALLENHSSGPFAFSAAWRQPANCLG